MYKLKQFTGGEAQDFALAKKKKIEMSMGIMRIVSIVGSIFFIIVFTFINSENIIGILLVYGLGTGVMGNWSISRVKKHNLKLIQEISDERTQYVCVDDFKCNTVLQFETMEGEIVEKTFSKDTYGKYMKSKRVYIIYIPNMNNWYVQTIA